jgi:hypothetical protein
MKLETIAVDSRPFTPNKPTGIIEDQIQSANYILNDMTSSILTDTESVSTVKTKNSKLPQNLDFGFVKPQDDFFDLHNNNNYGIGGGSNNNE